MKTNNKIAFVFDADNCLFKYSLYHLISEPHTFKEKFTTIYNKYELVFDKFNKLLDKKISDNKRLENTNFKLSNDDLEMFIDIIYGGKNRLDKIKEYFEKLKEKNIDIHISTRGYYGHINWALKQVGLDKYVKNINSSSGTRIYTDDSIIFYTEKYEEQLKLKKTDDIDKELCDIIIKELKFKDEQIGDFFYYKHMFLFDHILHKYNITYYADDSNTYHDIIMGNTKDVEERYLEKLSKCFDITEVTIKDNITIAKYDEKQYIFFSLLEEKGGINFGDNSYYPKEHLNISDLLI